MRQRFAEAWKTIHKKDNNQLGGVAYFRLGGVAYFRGF